MKIDEQKKSEKPDLRHGVKGSVLIKDTNENFAGKPSATVESGPTPVNPGVGVPVAGQTAHE
jgi:hypothetical protein